MQIDYESREKRERRGRERERESVDGALVPGVLLLLLLLFV